MTEKMPIWEYMPEFETQKQFNYFAKYYLPQELPRSSIAAYRNYRAEKLGLPVDDPRITKLSRLPLNWRRMAYAYDKDEKRISKMPTWSERGAAYDASRLNKLQELTQQMRVESTFESLANIRLLYGKFSEMIELVTLLKTSGVRTLPITKIDDAGKPYTVNEKVDIKTLNFSGLAQAAAVFDKIREMERREYGQPATIRQNQLADNEGNEFSVVGKGLTDLLQSALQDIQQWKRDNKTGKQEGETE